MIDRVWPVFLCACEDKLFVGLSHFLTIKNIKKRAQNSIIKDNFILDNKEINFGIRTFKIDPEEGFILNQYTLGLRREALRYL